MTMLQLTGTLHTVEHDHCGYIALFKEWWRRAQDRRALATMSEVELRDVGIARYDAYYEASKPFWRA